MAYCCELGKEYSLRRFLIHETENFFINAALGPLGIEGYLLLSSITHYPSISSLPSGHFEELEKLAEKSVDILGKKYNQPVIMFEHGPNSCRTDNNGGSCIDHAHLHIIPTSTDIQACFNGAADLDNLRTFDYWHIIPYLELMGGHQKDITNLNELPADSAYLFLQQHGKRKIYLPDFGIPSQFIRQLVSADNYIENPMYDWVLNPQPDLCKKTVEEIKPYFEK